MVDRRRDHHVAYGCCSGGHPYRGHTGNHCSAPYAGSRHISSTSPRRSLIVPSIRCLTVRCFAGSDHIERWRIPADIGIITFNDNGPRFITKPPLTKEPQLCPADTHQRRNSANAATPKDSIAARTSHQSTAAHHAASLSATASPTSRRHHEAVPRPLLARGLRFAAGHLFTPVSLTHTLRIDLFLSLRYF
jgi:hypothetical protein